MLEDGDHLVLAAIETAHAAIGLGPDSNVHQCGEQLLTDRGERSDHTPVGKDIVQRPVSRGIAHQRQRCRQEGLEFRLRHLAGCHLEL